MASMVVVACPIHKQISAIPLSRVNPTLRWKLTLLALFLACCSFFSLRLCSVISLYLINRVNDLGVSSVCVMSTGRSTLWKKVNQVFKYDLGQNLLSLFPLWSLCSFVWHIDNKDSFTLECFFFLYYHGCFNSRYVHALLCYYWLILAATLVAPTKHSI